MADRGSRGCWQKAMVAVMAGGLWALAAAVTFHGHRAEAERGRILTRDDIIAAVQEALSRQNGLPGSTARPLALRRLLSNCQILLEERRPEPGTPEAEQKRMKMVGWLRC
ncbi:MAG: hypothetical protein D6740_09460 [Alphaproteobacteria bacterium]|nr:MAG: hypothetical protein D6740_09460 [Alphaproteobacteria bacterium]